MKFSSLLILLGVLCFPFSLKALTLSGEALDVSYEHPPESLVDRIGRMPVSMGGGLLCGLMLFAVWKIRRGRNGGKSVGILLISLLTLQGTTRRAEACANIEYTTLENTYTKYLDTLDWFAKPVERALASRPVDDPHVTPNPAAYPTEPPAGIRENDEAVRMVLKGNAKGALEKLKQIETEHPGLYATAANMGTCYELTGDDGQALLWIRQGLQRNPYSHMLAEWLHVRVLEAKIALKADPSWLATHTITGFDPEQESFETEQGVKDTEGLLASFRSQCTVRALFIKPQDPVMAQLLYEAATFMLRERTNSIESTLALAVKYGLPKERVEALQARATAILTQQRMARQPGGFGVWFYRWKYPLIFLNALVLGFLIPVHSVLKRERAVKG